MIARFAEVWTAMLVAFVLGCVIGGALFALVARTALAERQYALALAVPQFTGGAGRRFRKRSRFAEGEGIAVLASQDDADWITDETDPEELVNEEDEDDAPLPLPFAADDFEDDEEAEPEDIEPDWAREAEPLRQPRASVARDETSARRASAVAPPRSTSRPVKDGDEPLPSSPVPPPLTRLPPPARRPPTSIPEGRPLLTAPPDTPVRGEGRDARRPALLSQPRNGTPDNLQRIRGIGARNEERLNEIGIFHFSQIAAWTPAEVRWIGQKLAFPERIELDDWVGQAIVLASGGDTGFTKSAERRRARRRRLGDVGDDEGDAFASPEEDAYPEDVAGPEDGDPPEDEES